MTRSTSSWTRVLGWAGTAAIALLGCDGCGGGTPAPPAPPVSTAPTPSTVRPIAVPAGGALTYVVEGPAGILDHAESGHQLPRLTRIELTRGADDHVACRIHVGAIPAGQSPKFPVPQTIDTEFDEHGIVRLGHADLTQAAHAHELPPEALAPRIYATLANTLLLRPNGPAPTDGATRWEDIVWFGAGEGSWPGRLFVEAQGTADIGGRTCQRFQWRMEAGPPQHYLSDAQVVDAWGISFYDAAAQQLVAAEMELRFAEDASAWGFTPWTWMRVRLDGVPYDGTEADGTWIDGAYTIQPDDPDPERPRIIAENTAIKRLYGMHQGMEEFRKAAQVDVDGDGQGEYGFLSELAGVTNLRTAGGLLGAKVPLVANANYTRFHVFRYHGVCDDAGRSRGEGYLWYCVLAGADTPLAQGVQPPAGDPRHADAQEKPGAWAIWGWPQEDSPARTVLHVDSAGVIHGTTDLPWRGATGGPGSPTLTRPTDGVTWEARSHEERVPPEKMKLVVLAPDVDVPPDTYDLLGRAFGNRIKLRTPDMFGTLPKDASGLIRLEEFRWRAAWRDRRVSVEELEPIVDACERILSGRAPR